MPSPFNSPLETGLRSLIILTEMFPRSLDLQFLVFFDYITVHSGDVGGPESLHAPLPQRSGELTVRRTLIERGLYLMISRNLVEHLALPDGFEYKASDNASSFISMLSSQYTRKLKDRAAWASNTFGDLPSSQIKEIEKGFFLNWSTHFQPLGYVGGNGI